MPETESAQFTDDAYGIELDRRLALERTLAAVWEQVEMYESCGPKQQSTRDVLAAIRAALEGGSEAPISLATSDVQTVTTCYGLDDAATLSDGQNRTENGTVLTRAAPLQIDSVCSHHGEQKFAYILALDAYVCPVCMNATRSPWADREWGHVNRSDLTPAIPPASTEGGGGR